MVRDGESVQFSEMIDFLNAVKNTDAERIKNISFYGTEITDANYKFKSVGGNNVELTEVLQTSQIVKIPKTVQGKNVIGIGDKALYGNLQVETIEIPEGIQYIKPGAFAYCINLKDVKLPQSLKKIGEYCYSDDENAIFYTNTYIGAFEGCNIESIDLPNKLEILGDNTFKSCYQLKYIYIPNTVKSVGRYCFSFCENLYKVILPDNINVIQNGMFYKCASLAKIDIPVSVRAINHHAFLGCKELLEIKFNERATYIGINAFKGCEKLKNLK